MFPHGLQFPGPGGEDSVPQTPAWPRGARLTPSAARGRQAARPAGMRRARGARCTRMSPGCTGSAAADGGRAQRAHGCPTRPRGSRTVFRASSVPALQCLKGRGERWLSPEVGRQASYCLRCRFSAAERSDQVLLCESRDVQAIKAHGCRGLRLFSAWI